MKNTMETQHHQHVCSSRQSSTRWTPTSDQIRTLKELYYYYNNGKIEGKNVFYWFQNHKARERQKKRFPPTVVQPPPSTFSDHMNHHHLPPASAMQIHHYHHHQEPPPSHVYGNQHKLYTTRHIGVSSQGVMAVGCRYGSHVAMEKSFRECSISPPGESKGRNFGSRSRISVDSRSFFDKIKPKKYENHHQDEEDQEGDTSTRIETLPLFPIHGGTHHDFFGGFVFGSWHQRLLHRRKLVQWSCFP